MKNIEILDLNNKYIEIKKHNNVEYQILKDKFKIEATSRIHKFNSLFNCVTDFNFDIIKDFEERNKKLIISSLHHTNNLNLFDFNIYINTFNSNIEDYILNDNILQLACFKGVNETILYNLKKDMLQDLSKISNQLNNNGLFDILTDISIFDYDFNNGNDYIIKIHTETHALCDRNLFNKLLDVFKKKYPCKINYIRDEIIFGSYIQNQLSSQDFELLKNIRDKSSSNFVIFYDDIKKKELRDKVISIISKCSAFDVKECFAFNDM